MMPLPISVEAQPIEIEDRIRIATFTNTTAIDIIVRVRTMDEAGNIVTTHYGYRTDGDMSEDFEFIRLHNGFLLGVDISIRTGSVTIGECFVLASIGRDEIDSPRPSIHLISGYIASYLPLSWPYSPLNKPQDGPGRLVVTTVANPAAGANWLKATVAGIRMRPISVRFRFVTDANVAARRVRLEYIRFGNILMQRVLSNTQPASTTWDYNFSFQAYVETLNATYLNLPFGDLVLPVDTDIRVQTDNIQATDQFSDIDIVTEEWIDQIV